jgi:hypothetical protein
MSWRNLKGEFQGLLTEALALKRESRALRPTIRALFNRSTLDALESRADQLFEAFAQADTRLAQAGNLDVGFNGIVMEAASYAIVASARESVRTTIHEVHSDIDDMRGRLNNLASVLLAVLAIVVSALAIFK